MIAFILVPEIVVLLVLCGALGILSAAEVAVPRIARGRVRRLLETDRRGAGELDALSDRGGHLVGGTALVRALAYTIGSVSVAWVLLALAPLPHEWMTLFVGGIVGMLVVFVFGEALPRTLSVHNPERVALASAPVARRLVSVTYPVARMLAAVWTWLVGLVAEEPVGDAWVTADEVRSGSGTDDEDAARDEAEDAIIDAVADFTNKIVREVMVPRTDMVCLEDTATVSEALDAIEQSGVSRLPVYHDTVDDILGVLYAKDLLLCLGRGTCDVPLPSIAREPFFVPETKPVEELLIEMRTKTHIAIVADEYGGTAGLVTIEDLLEEIVGEIFDEYDTEETMMVDLGDGCYRVDGRTPIDDLNAVFGTDVDLEADSVGGLFVELIGHIPDAGETLEVEGLLITVEDVEGNRIRRVLVEPATTLQKGAEDE